MNEEELTRIFVDLSDAKAMGSESFWAKQVGVDCIESACRRFGVARYDIVLLDRDSKVVSDQSLREQQKQEPESAEPDMRDWPKFLREQALHKSVPIIYTTHQTPEQVARVVQKRFLANLG